MQRRSHFDLLAQPWWPRQCMSENASVFETVTELGVTGENLGAAMAKYEAGFGGTASEVIEAPDLAPATNRTAGRGLFNNGLSVELRELSWTSSEG
jgi:hypothetical protein